MVVVSGSVGLDVGMSDVVDATEDTVPELSVDVTRVLVSEVVAVFVIPDSDTVEEAAVVEVVVVATIGIVSLVLKTSDVDAVEVSEVTSTESLVDSALLPATLDTTSELVS